MSNGIDPNKKSADQMLTPTPYNAAELGVSRSEDTINFGVFAPSAKKVELVLHKEGQNSPKLCEPIPMEKAQSGRWGIGLPKEADGLFYNFLVDGRDMLPPTLYNVAGQTLSPTPYNAAELGVSHSEDTINFGIFAPSAGKVELILYKEGHNSPQLCEPIPMEKNEQSGRWGIGLPKEADGLFYNYLVDGREVNDPYAKAIGINGERCHILELEKTNPPGWENDKPISLVNRTDAIIYEVHTRAFTKSSSSNVSPEKRGKFVGLVEEGTRSPEGLATGFDHLKEKGITHVLVMPPFDFSGIDETSNEPQYNWGYNARSFFAPDGTYATNAYIPDVRIREFKEMVQKLHAAGIGVILDMVYPHRDTCKGSPDLANLDRIEQGHYFRKRPDGSYADHGCGNEFASETPEGRKMVLSSARHLAEELHADGVRIDQMGLVDLPTLQEMSGSRQKHNPSFLIGGEGWDTPQDPRVQGSTRDKASQLRGVSFLNPDGSASIRGPFNGDGGPGGILQGSPERAVRLTEMLRADPGSGRDPDQNWNYVSNHDNLRLADLIFKTCGWANEEQRKELQKLAYGIVLVSQGIPYIYSGDEVLAHQRGNHNGYNLPDEISAFDWTRKAQYRDVDEFMTGMIKLRKAHPGFRIPTTQEIVGKTSAESDPGRKLIRYRIDGHANNDSIRKFEIVINYGEQESDVGLSEHTKWSVLANGKKAGNTELGMIEGNVVKVPPRTMVVLADKESYDKMKQNERVIEAQALREKMLAGGYSDREGQRAM